ncbi:Cuticle protein 6, partial [Eufriesea mexicana]
IPLILALSLASGTQLNLIPYAYLSNPLPVFHQFQNTRTGEHAYSYAGGPSAKEEIKDADGVLRGSYSYVDANGILQSAFYVADENGFRVAATNIPSDDNVEAASHIILARNAEGSTSSRKRRSIESISNPNDNKQRQEDSQNLQKDDTQAALKGISQPLLLTNGIPLATSHQSQVQVHSSARLDVTEGEAKAKPVDLQPILPVQTILGGLPVLARAPTYHENRIELHKELGIEGPKPKDAVKIDAEPLTILRSSPLVVPLPQYPILYSSPPARIVESSETSDKAEGIADISSIVLKDSIPLALEKKDIPILTTGIVKEAVPLVPIVKDAANLATATTTTTITSHGVSQIHGNSKVNVEPTLLVKTAPIAQLHPIVNVPVYL